MPDSAPFDGPQSRNPLHFGSMVSPPAPVDAASALGRSVSGASLLDHADLLRLDASRQLSPARRSSLGQFMTPSQIARLMTSMFTAKGETLDLLDAGAGVGSLTAAWVAGLCEREEKPRSISVTAYEIDATLASYLRDTIALCRKTSEAAGITLSAEVSEEDFIRAGVEMLRGDLFSPAGRSFRCAILNPPYKKINTNSETRRLLRLIGIETSNLYTGFLAIATKLLAPGGELVAITPRSFCNGPYFKPFREWFLREMTIRRIHVFESRNKAFSDDEVLQENIIIHAVKEPNRGERVVISSSSGPDAEDLTFREVDYSQLVRPDDPDRFIHIVPDELGDLVANRMATFTSRLEDLGLTVSTGRVVDFRADDFLRDLVTDDTYPLIYPTHFDGGYIRWPKQPSRKPNALKISPYTKDLVVPPGVYVLVKRFSAKEERRRVVAVVYDSAQVSKKPVGFENHLNYYHVNGGGLPLILAKGLAAFLNSTLVDAFFRQFNGHTQVNATDLRSLRYPPREQLEQLGSRIGSRFPDQEEVDQYVEEDLLSMSDDGGGRDPVRAKQRIDQALTILRDVGLPRAQQQERSALTLLALVDVKPDTPWSEASNPLRGITPMMTFFAEHYGKTYAPNSRETVRRQTVHQFLQAGLITINPDDPERPTNSGQTVYQVESSTLELIRTYGTPDWDKNLRTYLTSVETLAKRYAQERQMRRIPVTLPGGEQLTLSPDGQNILIEQIVNEFCPRFTPGGDVLYIGDTDEKFARYDQEALARLGVVIQEHGKMPDVIVYYQERNWLILIEAVTTHGPVNPKRREELLALFEGCTAGLVFVTAFLTRQAMVRYLGDIAWETEVWVADTPAHMIHFNGERFLGPY